MHIDLHDRRTQLGIGLVILGVLALLGNLGIFAGLARVAGTLLSAAAGVLVLRTWRDRPADLWMLPVGTGLIGLALFTLNQPWSGGAFLASIGLGFVALFATNERRWWAVIPAGVLLTLGLIAVYDDWLFPGTDLGGTMFALGLAATFAFLYLHPRVKQPWAIWPALAMGVIAILTVSFRGGWVLPVVLIGIGAWLLTRQARPTDVEPVASSKARSDASRSSRTIDAPSGGDAGRAQERGAQEGGAHDGGAHDAGDAGDTRDRS